MDDSIDPSPLVILAAPRLSQAIGAALPATEMLSAPDTAQALTLLSDEPLATLLIDLPAADCLAALRRLSGNPSLCLLVHLHSADGRFMVQAVQAGAAGFITHAGQVAAALQALQAGAPYLPPELAGALVRGLQRS